MADPSPSAAKASWQGLPTEIKLQILRHRLSFPRPLDRRNGGSQASRLLIPLLFVRNAELSALALEASTARTPSYSRAGLQDNLVQSTNTRNCMATSAGTVRQYSPYN